MGGATPKQYLPLAGSTVLELSLQALLQCEQIQAVAVALHADDARAQSLSLLADPRVVTVTGAAQRSGSVLAGLRALAQRGVDHDWVLVHDAARPCVRVADIQRLIDTVLRSGKGGLLAAPIVDTVKQMANSTTTVERTLDRTNLWRAFTPQMFRLGELRAALEDAVAAGLTTTDEAAAMELAGAPVQVIAGATDNIKVTVPEDLPLANWYLQSRSEDCCA